MDAGKRIKELRDQKGWTQKQLGEAAEWSEEYVRLIETGKRKPRKAIADLLKALGDEPGPVEAAATEIVRVKKRSRKDIEAHAEAHAMKHYADFVTRALPMPVTMFFAELADVSDTPIPVEPGTFEDRIEGMTWCSNPAGPIYCQVNFEVWRRAVAGEGRDRNCVAHEAAHALLHYPELIESPGSMFRDAAAPKPSEVAADLGLKLYEVADWQAGVWAAAWLMPLPAVRVWLETQYAVGATVTPSDLAKHFQVSLRSAEIRLESALPALAGRPNN